MCGRFTQKLTWSQIHDLYSLTASVVPLNLQPRYNGAPEQEFAACRLDNGGNRTMVQLRWGLVPSWARDVRIGTRLINARSETIHTKPSFGAAFRSRRCLVPAYGWFEWHPAKTAGESAGESDRRPRPRIGVVSRSGAQRPRCSRVSGPRPVPKLGPFEIDHKSAA